MPSKSSNPADLSVKTSTRWGKSDELATTYANQLYISHSGAEFYLVFGEATPPTESINKQSSPKYVEIRPVARIAVSPEVMIQMANVIGQNVSRFVDQLKQAAKNQGESQ
jgi:tripartite-type tricarboxylate transporter receptor subunit TctC